MSYALDDSWDNCTAVARAGNACFGLYARCGIWVARNTSDGFVPTEIAAAYGSPEQARKLVDVGLWEAVEGGYLAVDYLTLNPTAEKVRERRKADAERKARWRERGARKRVTRDETRESAGSHGVTPRVSPRSPAASKEAEGAQERRGPQDNPDWRTQPAFGTPRDPNDAERALRGAAAARANIRKPAAMTPRRDAGAELLAATQPPPDETSEDSPPPPVIPLRSA
jgi:hypothetical protein